MAWMLQPHNWTQAVRPNLYNIAYKRNLAYKGMGQLPPAPPLTMTYAGTPASMTTSYWRLRGLGQAFPDCSVDPNAPGCTAESPMPPITSPQAASGGSYPAGQLSWFPTGSVPANVKETPYGSVPGTTPAPNWLPWIIGGVLLLLALRR